mmetsp:Transcript_34/g.55  ORF Transcript_34/g.55 Transcript_34/m.55 type:complete len:216 (+) Transcript_34:148-795(+)
MANFRRCSCVISSLSRNITAMAGCIFYWVPSSLCLFAGAGRSKGQQRGTSISNICNSNSKKKRVSDYNREYELGCKKPMDTQWSHESWTTASTHGISYHSFERTGRVVKFVPRSQNIVSYDIENDSVTIRISCTGANQCHSLPLYMECTSLEIEVMVAPVYESDDDDDDSASKQSDEKERECRGVAEEGNPLRKIKVMSVCRGRWKNLLGRFDIN